MHHLSYDTCMSHIWLLWDTVSAAPMPAWQVRALCAWPGSAQVDPSPCLRLQFVFFPKGVVFSRSRKVHEILCVSLLGGCTHGLEILQLRRFGGHRRGWRSGGGYRGAKPTRQLPWERGRFLSFPKKRVESKASLKHFGLCHRCKPGSQTWLWNCGCVRPNRTKNNIGTPSPVKATASNANKNWSVPCLHDAGAFACSWLAIQEKKIVLTWPLIWKDSGCQARSPS